jgi:hypothetical protein
MMAICPAGPPKLIKPNFNQYKKASFSVGAIGASSTLLNSFLFSVFTVASKKIKTIIYQFYF